MKIPIIIMGQSKGILLSESILKKYAFMETAELELEMDGIKIRPSKIPRQGWANAFKEMHDAGDDVLLLDDSLADWMEVQ